jgi:hypothetical protein
MAARRPRRAGSSGGPPSRDPFARERRAIRSVRPQAALVGDLIPVKKVPKRSQDIDQDQVCSTRGVRCRSRLAGSLLAALGKRSGGRPLPELLPHAGCWPCMPAQMTNEARDLPDVGRPAPVSPPPPGPPERGPVPKHGWRRDGGRASFDTPRTPNRGEQCLGSDLINAGCLVQRSGL